MISSILQQYPIGPVRQIEYRGNAGGFSGADFWFVVSDTGQWCLRRWPPENPSHQRLVWIHQVLRRAFDSGCRAVACPVGDRYGQTIQVGGDRLWELAPWMTGTADFNRHPSELRLRNALSETASFHRAVDALHRHVGPSASIAKRWEQLKGFESTIDAIRDSSRPAPTQRLGQLRKRALGLLPSPLGKLRATCDSVTVKSFPLRVVIKDLWHDHLFFERDFVSGIVDFGALNIDTKACDLARLLGSLKPLYPDFFRRSTEIYREFGELSDAEQALIPWLDQTGVVLGCLNWLEWIFVHHRDFRQSNEITGDSDWSHVESRIERLVDRIDTEASAWGVRPF